MRSRSQSARWAVVNSNVAITDPGGVNRAKVNTQGQLSTSAAVSGAVTATPASPNQSYSAAMLVGESCLALPRCRQAGARGDFDSGECHCGDDRTRDRESRHDCELWRRDLGSGRCPRGRNVKRWFSFNPGVPFNTGHVLSIFLTSASHDGSAGGNAFIHGYLVPATQCSGATAPAACM